jgi:DNA-binding protein H-NS
MSEHANGEGSVQLTKRLSFDGDPRADEVDTTDGGHEASSEEEKDGGMAAKETVTFGSENEEMSVEELRQQQEELARKIQEKEAAERRQVIKQIVDVVNRFNVPLEDLFEALGGIKPRRKGVKAKIKYRDPDTGATWSGRGKEPAWIRGKKRDKFLIDEQEQET